MAVGDCCISGSLVFVAVLLLSLLLSSVSVSLSFFLASKETVETFMITVVRCMCCPQYNSLRDSHILERNGFENGGGDKCNGSVVYLGVTDR